MRHSIADREADAVRSVSYQWRHDGRWCQVGVVTSGPPGIPPADSEATFITEHYWGYARQRDGGTVEYQVEHPQWRVSPALESRFECDVAALYGAPFAGFLCVPPASAFLPTVRR